MVSEGSKQARKEVLGLVQNYGEVSDSRLQMVVVLLVSEVGCSSVNWRLMGSALTDTNMCGRRSWGL